MARKNTSEQDGLTIIGKAWGEIKKINWHEVNRLCRQNFHIGLVGTEEEVSIMKDWLKTFPYAFCPSGVPHPLSYKPAQMEQILSVIPASVEDMDEKLIKSTSFCLAFPRMADLVRRLKAEIYIFDPSDTTMLATQIMANHLELRFALSHRLPVFRPEHAKIVIQDTAFQNALWAVISSLPNTVPGPHNLLIAPFEGITDFMVLTINEMKLLFELVGLSGYRVLPLHHLTEFALIAGVAQLAQSTATTFAGRIPLRAGTIFKGAIAYAFTWAIGEGLFMYISTGHPLERNSFLKNFKQHFSKGKEVAANIIDNEKF
jgi:hypothetical protein